MNSLENHTTESSEFLGWMLTPGNILLDAIKSKNYQRAYSLLRNLKQPLEESEAGDCLYAAMSCTEKLFCAVLEKCVLSGAVANCGRELPLSGKHVTVFGTPLLAAAAFGNARHVQLLLAHGCDINAASPESAFPNIILNDGSAYHFCAQPGNDVSLWQEIPHRNVEPIIIHRCTPLAAAILAENQSTMDVLLQTPGVWKTESSAVCRAVAAYVDGPFPRFWELSWNVNGELLAPFAQDLDSLFHRTRMQAASFADFCTAELLEAQLKSGNCTESDIRELLSLLGNSPYYCSPSQGNSGIPDQNRKLLSIAKYYPALCREPKTVGRFLRAYLSSRIGGVPDRDMLDCWKTFSGKRRDISSGTQHIRCLHAAARKECLTELAEGGELYAAADALGYLSGAAIRDLLRSVHIIPSPIRTGLSAFGHSAIMCSGNKALMRRLFRGGFLDCEPRDALLTAADVSLRPLILTSSTNEPAEVYDLTRYEGHFRHWYSPHICSPEWLNEIVNEPLSIEECIARLIRLDFIAFPRAIHKDRPEFEATEFIDGLPAAKNSNALRAQLQLNPEFADKSIETQAWHHPSSIETFKGPPLALAAATGREDSVRFLLSIRPNADACCRAWFAEPEELLNTKSVVCTPLMLALWFEREETAKILLEAGANRDLSAQPYQTFMRAAPSGARKLAEKLGIIFGEI